MSITTWSGFLAQLTRLIDGDNISASEVNLATLQQVISLGERRIYREVRSRHNEKAFTNVLTTDNAAPIPVDFEATSVLHFGGGPLEPVTEEFILDYGTYGAGRDPKFFAEAGANFIFAPEVSDNSIVQGRYFCRLDELGTTTLPTNALFLNETDLFVYGCLSVSAPFWGQDSRIQVWDAQYRFIRDTINENKNRAAYSSGRIQQRPSASMLRYRGYRPATLGTGGVAGQLALDGLALGLDSQTLGLT